jgi:hypothetical protein
MRRREILRSNQESLNRRGEIVHSVADVTRDCSTRREKLMRHSFARNAPHQCVCGLVVAGV